MIAGTIEGNLWLVAWPATGSPRLVASLTDVALDDLDQEFFALGDRLAISSRAATGGMERLELLRFEGMTPVRVGRRVDDPTRQVLRRQMSLIAAGRFGAVQKMVSVGARLDTAEWYPEYRQMGATALAAAVGRARGRAADGRPRAAAAILAWGLDYYLSTYGGEGNADDPARYQAARLPGAAAPQPANPQAELYPLTKEELLALVEEYAGYLADGGSPQRALPFLQEVVRQLPDRPSARLRLADALAATGRPTEADRQYRVFADLSGGGVGAPPPRGFQPGSGPGHGSGDAGVSATASAPGGR